MMQTDVNGSIDRNNKSKTMMLKPNQKNINNLNETTPAKEHFTPGRIRASKMKQY
jgi:hypothetical protein